MNAATAGAAAGIMSDLEVEHSDKAGLAAMPCGREGPLVVRQGQESLEKKRKEKRRKEKKILRPSASV